MDWKYIIGNNIREIRKSKGLTQEDLADKCYPMNRCSISRLERFCYEKKKDRITIGLLSRIADALEVDITKLLK